MLTLAKAMIIIMRAVLLKGHPLSTQATFQFIDLSDKTKQQSAHQIRGYLFMKLYKWLIVFGSITSWPLENF